MITEIAIDTAVTMMDTTKMPLVVVGDAVEMTCNGFVHHRGILLIGMFAFIVANIIILVSPPTSCTTT